MHLIFLNTQVSAFAATPKADVNFWHDRLGHVNLNYIKELSKGAATGIELYGTPKSCPECVEGKLNRKPFKVSHSRAEKKLQLIHTDVCQVDCRSLGKAKYFLTFIDDHSRRIFLYFLKHKSDVFNCFKDFKNRVENKTDLKIKVLRSDNGGE